MAAPIRALSSVRRKCRLDGSIKNSLRADARLFLQRVSERELLSFFQDILQRRCSPMCIRRVNHASNNLSFPASHAFRLGLFAGLVFICTFSTALADGPRHPVAMSLHLPVTSSLRAKLPLRFSSTLFRLQQFKSSSTLLVQPMPTHPSSSPLQGLTGFLMIH